MYSLILTDIDGTLLRDDLSISPKTIEAFARAREKGIRIVLSSGRYIQGMRFLAEELGLKDPIYSAINGALIKDGNTIVRSERIEKDAYSLAAKLLNREAKSITAFAENEYAIDSDDKWFEIQNKICRKPGVRMDIRDMDAVEKALNEPVYKILIKDDRPNVIKTLMARLEEPLKGKATLVTSASTNFEVLPLNTDKKNAVDALEQYLNIPREEMIAFGDWNNDLGMIQSVGMGIAMGNGSEEVKNSAKLITKTNNEDGIYYALHDILNVI